MLPSRCCPDFNAAHGCGKQRFCPHGLWHTCSFLPKGGTLCGSKNRTKIERISRVKAGQHPDAKGSGDPEGKAKGKNKGNDKHKGNFAQAPGKRQR